MPSAPLDQLAEIRTGYTVRGKAEPGDVRVVHVADLAGNVLDSDRIAATTDATPGYEHRLRAGDVLLASRGERNPAAVVEADLRDTVAASYLYVLRAEPGRPLDPAYLAWYLNTRPAQDFFDTHAHGTYSVRRIRIDDVRALPVPLPPLGTQRGIVQAARTAQAEADIARRLADRRLALSEAFLLQTALRHG